MLDGRLLHNHFMDFDSVFWRLSGSTSATRWYKEHPYAVNIHGVTGWRSHRLDAGLLHIRLRYFNFVSWRLLGSTSATRRYKVRLCRIKTHEVVVFCGGVLVVLVEFHSMAVPSTAAGRIPILFAGGCWARYQLPNGIRYVPIA